MERMIGKLAASLAFCAFAASAQTVQSLESAPAEQNPAEPAAPATVTTTTESASTTTAGGNVTVINNYYGTAPGAAAAPAEPKGFHTHDGFYMNLSLGFGYGSLNESAGGADGDYTGAAGAFAWKIGGSLSKAVALYAVLHDFVISDPDVDISGYGSGSADDLSIGVVGFGVGATIYPGEGNFYVSPSVSFAEVGWQVGGGSTAYSTEGTLLRCDVGYEWWVSANWSLGASLVLQHYSGEKDGIEDSANFFGVVFSATFN